MRLLSPLSGNLKDMKSLHTAQSGTLVVSYPREWEGKITGETTSGSLSLKGEDVDIIEEGGRGSGRYVVAEKGDGEGKLEFRSQSGSADVRIGF